jgi:tetratricopeptide (TPR) repeat protein
VRAPGRIALAAMAGLVSLPLSAAAFAEPGTKVDDVELKSLAGRTERLFAGNPKATVLVFVRTSHERSAIALKDMASCEKALKGKPVRWAAVISSSEPMADAKADAAAAGIAMPVLVDEGDALYSKLDIRLHPTAVIIDAKHQIVSFEPFRQVEYCEIVKTRIRFVLGEIDQAAVDRVTNPVASSMPGDDPTKKAMRDIRMAQRLVEIESYDLAIQKAQRALEIAPMAEAYAVMGDAYRKLGRCPDASKAYAAALKLNPSEPQARDGQKGCP